MENILSSSYYSASQSPSSSISVNILNSSSPSIVGPSSSSSFRLSPSVTDLFVDWMSRRDTENLLEQALAKIQQTNPHTAQAINEAEEHAALVRSSPGKLQRELQPISSHNNLSDPSQPATGSILNIKHEGVSMLGSPVSSPNKLVLDIKPSSSSSMEDVHPNSIRSPTSITSFAIHPPSTLGQGNFNAPNSPGARSPLSPSRSFQAHPLPLDPAHLTVDEVSLRASPPGPNSRKLGIDPNASSSSPLSSPDSPSHLTLNVHTSGINSGASPPTSPASLKRKVKPLNIPSSPRVVAASPPRSPIRSLSSTNSPNLRGLPIRQFYFPDGVPPSPGTKKREADLIDQLFSKHPDNAVGLDELFPLTTFVCGFSSYCNCALFDRLLLVQNGGSPPAPALLEAPRVKRSTFDFYWSTELEKFDPPTRFFRMLRSNNRSKFLTRDDFKPIVQEIVNRHPGLEFLEATPEFQLKYAQTVIARIFYQVNKSGNEQLTLRELKNSNFLLMLQLLDQEDDINKLNDYFSYEHFYVIYCKFWELDSNHDGYIDANDLLQYDDFSLTNKIVDRIIHGCGRRLLSPLPLQMNYLDFVIFLVSEVDKNNDVAIEYWFNCIDLDTDGIIATYEIEYFFDEQKQRIQQLSQEPITFPDILCQLIDMVKKPIIEATGVNENGLHKKELLKPKEKDRRLSASGITLSSASNSPSQSGTPISTLTPQVFHSSLKPYIPQNHHLHLVSDAIFYKEDLRASKMAPQFFNTLFNLNKFVLSEQRDPLRIKQIHDTPQLSDWDRYAISGYYRLAECDNESANVGDNKSWADLGDVQDAGMDVK